MMPITVFTPTYNRAKLLIRCYESMCRQTSKQFVWMIVDDGSNDNTKELVEGWQEQQHSFEIQYIYKKNEGLHTAYNEAIAHIETPLCVCIDSDDWMPDDAVEKILDFWNKNASDDVAGIVGLDYTAEGKVIGDLLPNQKKINLIDLLIGKYPIRNGDRTNVVRTDLYKKYSPMKVFPGEKNFNPHYMHLQISQEYDFLVFNENLRFVEYQLGGMSDSMLLQYRNSPNSFAETRRLYLSFPDTGYAFKFRHTTHLIAECILAGNVSKIWRYSPNRGIALICFPIGYILSKYIYVKTSKR